jgi:hypothetical protein
MRTDYKIGRIPAADRPALAEIGDPDPRRAFYALCVYAWACLPAGTEGLETPEQMADRLEGPEQQQAAIKALHAAAVEAGVIKKKEPEPLAPPPSSRSGPLPC